jgi:4-diphosphocytidyl-2-C-methyl-D-erythritol kinase
VTTLIAPAKVNLYLAVGPARPDGYHPVTTVLCALEFGDTVTVEPAERLSLVCAPALAVADADNLAWRAALAMGEAFGRAPDFAIRIEKRVPAGAGLAGGSADAAAVIAALAQAWEVRRDDARLEVVAAALGADVPFALRGGCGVYGGLGATPQRTLKVPAVHVAVVGVPDPVPTAAAYRAFDEAERLAAPGPRHVTDAVSMSDARALGAALFNNMTAVSTGIVPAIADELASMSAASGCLGAAMCGSGSAVFGLFATSAEAQSAADDGAARGRWSIATRPRSGGTLEQAMGPDPDAVPKVRHPRTR